MSTNVLIAKIALVLFIEARGESEEGMRGTASVMWERGNGNTVTIVQKITSKRWNGAYGQRLLKTTKPDPRNKAYIRAQTIATEMVNRRFRPSFRANLVHATSIKKPSDWKGAVLVATIGRQKFYFARNVI